MKKLNQYISSFCYTSLKTYGEINLGYLYNFSAPIYLINALDFKFENINNEDLLIEIISNNHETIRNFISQREGDIHITNKDNTSYMTFYLVKINEQYFYITEEKSNVNIWTVLTSEQDIIEDIEYDLCGLFEKIKSY